MPLTSADAFGVTRSPEIWGGAAVIAGSAIPVFMVEDLYNETGGIEAVLESYPWHSRAAVLRALAYAAEDSHLVEADRARHREALRKHEPRD